MAAMEVFGVAELLEMILLELPMKELLLSQAVCKTWRSTTTTSSKLQRALFLLPGTASDAPIEATRPDAELGVGHRFVKALDGNLAFNPLLVDSKQDGRSTDYKLFHLPITTMLRSAKTGDPNASCRRMYLTQPPVELNIWCCVETVKDHPLTGLSYVCGGHGYDVKKAALTLSGWVAKVEEADWIEIESRLESACILRYGDRLRFNVDMQI